MNTFLGASVEFSPADVDESIIAASSVLYLEGYLFIRRTRRRPSATRPVSPAGSAPKSR